MSTTVVALFAVGLVLLAFEVIMPGAVLGIIGGVALLIGVVVAWTEHGAEGGLLALTGALGSVVVLLLFEFVVLPRTRFGRRFFLHKAIDATSQPPVAEDPDTVVGREAVAVTALAPTGVVRVDGRRYEARCESGFAEPGERLRVVRVETFHLVVIASG